MVLVLDGDDKLDPEYIEKGKSAASSQSIYGGSVLLDAYIWGFRFYCLPCRRKHKSIFIPKLLSGDTHSQTGCI